MRMKKIVIIEDDQILRSTLRELLELNSYRVFAAEDGIAGVQLAKEINPDLIICDIMMPRLSGIGVVQELKEHRLFYSVPFIFLTAKSDLSDIREGMEIGADDYVTKPFRADTILKAISARLEKFSLIKSRTEDESYVERKDKQTILSEDEKLFLNTKAKQQFIKVGDILFIKAMGEYSELHLTSGTEILIRKLMKQWEEQLPGNIFLRIHRSTIINLNQIESIERWFKRSFIISLKGSDEKFIVSQRFSSRIKSKFVS